MEESDLSNPSFVKVGRKCEVGFRAKEVTEIGALHYEVSLSVFPSRRRVRTLKTKDVLKRTEMSVLGMRTVSVVTARYDHDRSHMEYLHHSEFYGDDGAVIQAPTIYSRENALAAHYRLVSEWLELGATKWEDSLELTKESN